jgi:hypothetical protein
VLIGHPPPCDEPGTELSAHRRALADAVCRYVVEERAGIQGGGPQPELDGLLGRLQPGDVLVVPHLDSLARPYPTWCALQRVAGDGACLQVGRRCRRWRIPASVAKWAA